MSHKSDHRITFAQSLLCSGISIVFSRTATAPADVMKTLTQVGIPQSKNGFIHLSKVLYKQEGLRCFFKGNLTGCLKLFPYSIIHYMVLGRIYWTFSDGLGRMSAVGSAMTGVTAGMAATVVTYPMDLIKTRIIVQPGYKQKHYKSIVNALYRVWKDEGFRQLYKGLYPTLAASVPFTFTSFLTYESLDALKYYRNKRTKSSQVEVLIQGMVSSTVSIIVTFPFDVIRRMMQAQSSVLPNNGGVDMHFTTARECGRKLRSTHGILGLWRGLIPALLRVIPYHSLMFLTYEMCKRGFLYQNGYILSPFQVLNASLDQNIEIDEMQDIQDYDITWHTEHRESMESMDNPDR